MASGSMNKTAAATAADVCKHFELSKEGAALLQPGQLPRPFLEALIAQQYYPDAARFMAHAMPRREAIWWGCLCARQAYGDKIPEKHKASLQLAETWVEQPTDANRRAAFKAAESAEFKNPAGLLGLAVFFSAGSIAPPGLAEVSAEPNLSPNSVANSIILAAVLNDSAKAPERFPQFFALGFDVANGKNRWK